MEDFKTMLVDMGFSKEKAEKGLQMTGNKSVQAAMEWIFDHPDDDSNQPSTSSASQDQDAGSAPSGSEQQAKSLKCNVCNRLFSSQLDAEYHATKSGHADFEESTEEKKPLTQEEKAEQLRLIEEKMKQKRKEREEKEKEEALVKERIRIKSGKEMTEVKRKMEEEEMKKILYERKREKEEERKARQRVKDLIEADKLARKAAQSPNSEKAPAPPPSVPEPTKPITPTKDYDTTKIQVRLTDGSSIMETFSANESLAAVRVYVQLHRTDPPCEFNLMTTFPRKVFSAEDYEKSLKTLGLVPSAVIIVSKAVF